jgi:hypothetical protein
MRRILVENARRRGRRKRGGDARRVDMSKADLAVLPPSDDLLAISEVLDKIAQTKMPELPRS